MKHILVVGRTASGKTTLLQRLMDQPISYKKTYAIEIVGDAIDTPGEYMDHKRLFRSLLVTCTEAEALVLVHDCTDTVSTFFPGMASAFQIPVIGVVSKTDLGDEQGIRYGEEILKLAGADKVYKVSSYSDEGIDVLREYLCSDMEDIPNKRG